MNKGDELKKNSSLTRKEYNKNMDKIDEIVNDVRTKLKTKISKTNAIEFLSLSSQKILC